MTVTPSTSKVQTGTVLPPNAGKGRKKGVPNKVTADVKAMILQALSEAGGAEYLKRCAQDQRTAGAFLTLVGKVLPLTVHGSGAKGELVFSRIVREIVDPS